MDNNTLIVQTWVVGNVVGVLRIKNGKGILAYVHVEDQGEIAFLEHAADCASLSHIADAFCTSLKCRLISY